MSASYRAGALTLALTTIVACENPFANGALPGSAGVPVPGLTNLCTSGYGCMAWSADSKTLYITAQVGTANASSLVAIDPLTLTVRTIGNVGVAFSLAPSADGAAAYFEAPDFVRGHGWIINRMSLSDGTTMTMTGADRLDFVVSPDGTSLAYHVVGSQLATDTIALLDIPSRTRRGTTAGPTSFLQAFSSDGVRLAMIPSGADAVHIWNVITGAREMITIGSKLSVYRAAWSGGDFRVLRHSSDFMSFTDTSLAGGPAIIYRVGRDAGQVLWVPDRSAVWAVPESVICGPEDCNDRRYDFIFTTATTSTTLGATSVRSFLIVAASPDGQWIAHAESPTQLFLLHRPSP